MSSGDQTGPGQWPDSASAPINAQAFKLILYVAGQSPKSVRAIANLRAVCEEHLAGRYTVEVIDLIEQPNLARRDEIIAVPTLVRRLPQPLRKIIGDLSDPEQVLVGLQLRSEDPGPTGR